MAGVRSQLLLAALVLTAGSTGCGLTRSLAVKSFVPILEETVNEVYRDPDTAMVESGIPGNLLLLRGLCRSEPGNAEVQRLTAQSYFSYAMGFVEDRDPARASLIYNEGMRLGLEALRRRSWFRRAEEGTPLPDASGLRGMKRTDVPLVFWTVANWSSWIGQNLDRPEAVAQLPRVQAYLDRVLELQPDYFFGMPHVLLGSLLGFRPRMLGGDPEKGKEQFEEAFRISQGRMMVFQVLYAKYYCRQVLDQACFDQSLQEVLQTPADKFPDYRLWNEIAQRKARHLQQMRDELF